MRVTALLLRRAARATTTTTTTTVAAAPHPLPALTMPVRHSTIWRKVQGAVQERQGAKEEEQFQAELARLAGKVQSSHQ